MGLTTGNFPPVDPATFMETPYRERIKTLARHWAEYGFGAPKITRDLHRSSWCSSTSLGGVLVAHAHLGPGPAAPGGVVGRADRLPEGRPVDGAARVPRRSPARGARWPVTSSR